MALASRIRSTLLAVFLFASFASPAAALIFYEVSVSSDSAGLRPGDEVTLGIHAETTTREALVLGLRAVYDDAALEFVRGVVPDTLFNFLPSLPFGGIDNFLSEPTIDGLGPGPSVSLFQGLAIAPAGGTGEGEGEQFSVTFRVQPGFEGETQIDVGAFEAYFDIYLSTSSTSGSRDDDQIPASVAFTIVPEPSAGLLLGFGLVGLASYREASRRG